VHSTFSKPINKQCFLTIDDLVLVLDVFRLIVQLTSTEWPSRRSHGRQLTTQVVDPVKVSRADQQRRVTGGCRCWSGEVETRCRLSEERTRRRTRHWRQRRWCRGWRPLRQTPITGHLHRAPSDVNHLKSMQLVLHWHRIVVFHEIDNVWSEIITTITLQKYTKFLMRLFMDRFNKLWVYMSYVTLAAMLRVRRQRLSRQV